MLKVAIFTTPTPQMLDFVLSEIHCAFVPALRAHEPPILRATCPLRFLGKSIMRNSFMLQTPAKIQRLSVTPPCGHVVCIEFLANRAAGVVPHQTFVHTAEE
jgi:hypothetical protein